MNKCAEKEQIWKHPKGNNCQAAGGPNGLKNHFPVRTVQKLGPPESHSEGLSEGQHPALSGDEATGSSL